MDKSEHSALSFKKARAKQAAFSLVEVTLAIGIAAFAFVAVFGLIPVGLNTFHQSMDTSLGAQIVQRVINDAQQTDFNTLIGNNSSPFLQSPTPRYFDGQGNEVASSVSAIYQINTRITPITVTPHDGSIVPPQAQNANLATVTVQIANNPRNLAITLDSTTKLWNDSRVPINTYSAIVSKNQ